MDRERIKELLGQQLELLAEESRESRKVYRNLLPEFSREMREIATVLLIYFRR